MKKRLIVLLPILALLGGTKTMAQADISLATHWYNRANYNPAFIARTDYMYIFGNVRQQWLGVDGAPTVCNIQASNYINRLNSAFGISMLSDHIGVTQVFNPMLTYAYRVEMKHDQSLSLGLSGGMFYRSIDGTKYDAVTSTDAAINYSVESETKPDVNFGMEWQSKHFILGLSSTHLLSLNRTDTTFLNTNHRYAYLIYKNNSLDWCNYSIGTQVANRENLTVMELNGNLRFKQANRQYAEAQETYELGLTLRSTKQITLLLGMNITPNLKLGYAYDQNLFSGFYQNSTHELMLEWRIPNAAAEAPVCKYSGWYR
jgi:type IX secretion system PorP/SprF family membrane protein